MIKTIEYTKEKARTLDFSKANITESKVAQKTLYWVDFLEPSEDDLRDMAKNLNFLIVDLKKCLDNSSRSAIIQRNNYTLILYKGISEKNKVVTLGIFLTKNYIVTVHKSSITSLNNIQSITLAETPTNIVKNGINYLLHQITEEIGREYFKLFDEIDDELDKLEEKIFKKTKANIMQEIFAVKKVVIYSRQALHANRDALNDLEKIFQPTDREMIHQLHNDIIQLIDENNLYHERLTGVVDAYLTKQSNDLNEIMKSFTVIASLILLPTLIAGAYGMNLVLPLRDHPQGFWILLGIMIVGVVLMLFFFKKKEWV
ncbi:magnesium transporter CorA family protein [Candidatus Woesearchaeota archaeon]|nr:magnesium transporter CorA family protein [Candidatus Woesearchaeota archaeon]